MSVAFSRKTTVFIVGVCVLLGALVSTSVYFYLRAKELENKSPSEKQLEQVKQIVTEVSRVMALPTDEIPTVATITDPDKLKNQSFFASSLIGDKVLMYQNAKKAILYRPSERKIIEVTNVSIGPVASESSTLARPVRVVLYNGTTVAGLTKKYEAELLKAIPSAVIIDRDNAKKTGYEQSMFIDVSGVNDKEAQQYATKLGMTFGKIPDGEHTPTNADYLIILGSDKALQ